MFRTRSFLCLFVIVIIQASLVVIWFAYFHFKQDDLFHMKTVSDIRKKPGSPSDELKLDGTNELHHKICSRTVSCELHDKIKESFRRSLQVNIVDKTPGKSLSYNFQELSIPPKIDNKDRAKRRKRSFDKYVFVFAGYTEQMSMSMLSVLSLCGQAQYGGRKVVRPLVRDGRFNSNERHSSLGILFDLNHLDFLLDQAGYSPMVDKQEYITKCKPTDPNHVTIHFLYIGHVTKIWNKRVFNVTVEFYDSLLEKTKATGWTECSFLDKHIGIAPSTKQFCINPTIIRDWKIVERDIVGGATCLNIYLWRGIGGGKYRSYFIENNLKFPHPAIQFALKPSSPIQNEVNSFRKKFLPKRFIAVYLRAEFVLVPNQYNINLLKSCIDVIVEVIDVLKNISGISHVYVASDMAKYGSKALLRYVAKAKLDHNPFPEIFTSLVSRTGGVAYNYNASTTEIRDRGAIALVDLTILNQAQYLVTAGQENMSSFLRWVIGTFLANHRDDKELWSKVSVCGN